MKDHSQERMIGGQDVYIMVSENIPNDISIDTTKHTYRRLTTKNVKKYKTYLNQLTNLMGETRLFQKVNSVKKDIQRFLKDLNNTNGYIGNEAEEQ